MFFWEVIFRDKCGNQSSLYSLKGYQTERAAIEAFYDANDEINSELARLGCVLVVDEHIVFKMTKSLY